MAAAELGMGPWDALHQGLAELSDTSIGLMNILTGILVLLAWFPLRERPGLGTVLNVIIIGVVIDLTLLWLETPAGLLPRVLMMLSGPLLFGVGSGFYLGAGLGSGPRDGVMTGLARRGWPVGVARTTIEVMVLVVGWLLGGTVGVGTVVFALGIGPLVHVVLPPLTIRPNEQSPPPPGVRSAR